MMAMYLISVDAHGENAKVLDQLMLEKGAKAIAPGEWILEAESGEAMSIYDGIAAVVGDRSVFVKDLSGGEFCWDKAVVSQDLFFDMLKGEVMPMIEKRLKE